MQRFDSVLDEMEFIPAAKDLGLEQYRLAVIRYDAVLSWERFPYRLCAPQLLMALMAVCGELKLKRLKRISVIFSLKDLRRI